MVYIRGLVTLTSGLYTRVGQKVLPPRANGIILKIGMDILWTVTYKREVVYKMPLPDLCL